MSRYIDADALREALEIGHDCEHCEIGREYCDHENISIIDVCVTIAEQKTVDAVEVKHGHWIDTGSGQECSICGEIQYGYDSGRFYCQNCGAKMDEVTK